MAANDAQLVRALLRGLPAAAVPATIGAPQAPASCVMRTIFAGMRVAARVGAARGKLSRHHAASEGSTPLHLAARRADLPLCAALLELGASPSARNLLGQTPLQLARWLHSGNDVGDSSAAVRAPEAVEALLGQCDGV